MSADDDDLMDLPQESAEGELPTWTLAPLHLQKVYKIMNPRTKIPLFWSQMFNQVKNKNKIVFLLFTWWNIWDHINGILWGIRDFEHFSILTHPNDNLSLLKIVFNCYENSGQLSTWLGTITPKDGYVGNQLTTCDYQSKPLGTVLLEEPYGPLSRIEMP